MIDIYHYNAQTGEFVSPGVAHEDPLLPGQHPLPAHSTAVQPPAAQEGRTSVWNGVEWQSVEDHRGASGWLPDGTPHTVTVLGPLPEGWSDTAPEPSEEEALEAALAAIEARYTAKAAVLRERMEIVLLVNGSIELANRAALAAEWQATQDARDAEILGLLGGM
ncbi:hypothetical protein [Nitratidesulfovibrio sp. 1201_IL3209]|uniref:hypothetical protein n=1 Tax=Nitratidesulfovibrio sp. 1201_IL3209 TaxID=3084053 RepID=UPI002FD9A631